MTARTCIVGAQSKKRRAEPSRARRRCLAAGLGARASRPPRYRVGRTAALLHASSAPRRWSQRARLIAGGDAGEHGRRRRAAVRDDSCREVNLSTQRTAAPRAARWCEAGLGAPAGLEDATRRAAAGPLRVKCSRPSVADRGLPCTTRARLLLRVHRERPRDRVARRERRPWARTLGFRRRPQRDQVRTVPCDRPSRRFRCGTFAVVERIGAEVVSTAQGCERPQHVGHHTSL